MVIATLPTLTSGDSMRQGIKVLSHPLINAVRYNTGGDTPKSPAEILSTFKYKADRLGKELYIDLEGRQLRVARWVPFERGSVTLNKDFDIELPGQIHFRGLGWFDIVNADPEKRKIFFNASAGPPKYYLGESQSAHVVAKKFQVKGYLGDTDILFVKAAINHSLSSFMLSFVETDRDVYEFYSAYNDNRNSSSPEPRVVLKIESTAGIEFTEKTSVNPGSGITLMAARDDLFLAYKNKRVEFLKALKTIVRKNPGAILASKIMSGLESGQEVTVGDMADLVLMSRLGYKNFMFSDEITKNFDWAMEDWRNIMLPLLSRKTKR